MEFSAKQISELLGGTVEGNPDSRVTMLSKIEEGQWGSLTFLANPKYTAFIYSTRASVVVVNNDFVQEKPIQATLIRVKDAYQSFAKLLEIYNEIKNKKAGIDPVTFIDPSVSVPADAYIGSFAYIGKNVILGKEVKIYPNAYIGDNCELGSNSTIFPGVKIYRDCKIGNNCTIHAGVVIGGDGFGFAPQAGTEFKKVAQTGNVIIEDNVEIGSNTTIDRATLGSTIIRKGVKLDNLIQIGHNVEIGENTVIAAQTGIAGSVKIGKNCMVGGQVGFAGHLTIGDNVKIAAKSGVGHDIKEGELLMGAPAFPAGAYNRSYVLFRKLPDLEKRISDLEKELAAARNQL